MKFWSNEWKEFRYDQLKTRWADCEQCELSKNRRHMVFGEGNLSSKIMFIGEGPGEAETKAGRPFVGQPGLLLEALLSFVGLHKEDLFFDNIVACPSVKGREPSAAEKSCCQGRLYETIYLVDPWIVVPVGKVALTTLLHGRSHSIEKLHGTLFSSPNPNFRINSEGNGLALPGKFFPKRGQDKKVYELEYDMIPIFSPSYILREEGIDMTKNDLSFSPIGPSKSTVDDLAKIHQLVQNIESEYQRQQGHLRRLGISDETDD